MSSKVSLSFAVVGVAMFFLIASAFFYALRLNAYNATLIMTVEISVCGNGEVQGGEECDGLDLAGASCVTLGYGPGTLSCEPACEFDTSLCGAAPFCGDFLCSNGENCSTCSNDCGQCPSGGGGGGGGGASYIMPSAVTFSGRAYPLSAVTILKDGKKVMTTVSGPDARFAVTLTDLVSGNYSFSVFGEDSEGRRSSPFTFPIYISSGASTTISGIFLSPLIDVDKTEVRRGDTISIFGKTVPESAVTIVVNSENEIFLNTESDAAGVYFYNFDTSVLEIGSHLAKSKAAYETRVSDFGKAIGFSVGNKNVTKKGERKLSDLNNDGRVNIVDFSILMFWFNRPLTAESKLLEADRLSGDGKVNLTDFSILMFHWTG